MTFRAQLPSVGVGSTLAPPPFNTTYSKIKNFEVCPKRSYHLDIAKDVKEQETPELARGNELHGAMASRIRADVNLPMTLRYMEPWAVKLAAITHPLQIIMVEQSLGIGRNLEATTMMEKKALLRMKVDYTKIIPSARVAGTFLGHVVDYKTGKPKDDFTQLAMYALAIFVHYKDITDLRVDFLWTEYNDTSHEKFSRSDMPKIWEDLLPRVETIENAVKAKNFPAKPGGLCKDYCPIRSCEHNGKRVKA